MTQIIDHDPQGPVWQPPTTPPPRPKKKLSLGKKILAVGIGLFVAGGIISALGGSQTKSTNALKGAIADTTAPTSATTATTADSETLTQKLDRFFAQDPNLASTSPADRVCAEKELSNSMTTYELDNLLAADHSDSAYQLAVQGAKLTVSGCHLENTP